MNLVILEPLLGANTAVTRVTTLTHIKDGRVTVARRRRPLPVTGLPSPSFPSFGLVEVRVLVNLRNKNFLEFLVEVQIVRDVRRSRSEAQLYKVFIFYYPKAGCFTLDFNGLCYQRDRHLPDFLLH